MLSDVDLASDEQFQQKFRRMNMFWLLISIIYTGTFCYAILSSTPVYLHDWRGGVIIGFSLLIVAVYAIHALSKQKDWPPSLSYALAIWLSMYVLVILLTLIDTSFIWYLYTVFGVSFALFSSRRLILAVCVIALTLFTIQGLFVWPIGIGQMAAIVGQSVALFAMTAISMLSQHLIGERYERNQLLRKLSQTNSELEEAHQQLAASAAQERELAVLRERTRLAREMHDTLGHALVLVSVKLEAAQRLRERDPQRSDRELEATKEVVRNAMKELRASIANLRSPALEYESAAQAISRYAQEMAQRTGLQVSCELHPDIEKLPEQVEEILWKVGQEALSNVEKHAHASSVTLQISRQNGHVFMRIQDDGIGMPQDLCQLHADGSSACVSPEGHYGLSGMFERVDSVGGSISVHPGLLHADATTNQHGTTIEVELPLVGASL